MINNREITLAVSQTRYGPWHNQKITIKDFYEKLRTPIKSQEIYAAYLQMTKKNQDNLKDVGGFVGGELNGTRKSGNVSGRDLITLDVDKVEAGGTQRIIEAIKNLQCSYVIYSTRKHCEAAPRLRIIFPLNRTVSSDEYEAIARRMAQYCDPTMEMFDHTTFQPERLMYWPSISNDAVYVYSFADAPLIDADGVMATYSDWRDIKLYPRCPYESEAVQRLADKQGNPLEKNGVVGAFCRVYDIHAAIEKFIPNVYTLSDTSDDRLTFNAGSTSSGVVVYGDGLYIYSHHATDPTSGKLCNAFDMVRLHMYADKDEEAKPDTPITRMPSFLAFSEFLTKDAAVQEQFEIDKKEAITADFAHILAEYQQEQTQGLKKPKKEKRPDMKFEIKRDTNGIPKKTIDNAWSILELDPVLKDKIALDVFAGKGVANGPYPWDPTPGRRIWTDNDDNGVLWYLEKYYDYSGRGNVMSALSLCGNWHSVDPVREYLDSLHDKWDKQMRLDTLFIDYLGAADNAYTRAATRKALVAAVARTYEPGCKFDTMTILDGRQGAGKSTLLAKLGKSWFSDNLQSFEGKDAQEQIQGVWIVEIGELGYMNKTETNQVKQFLSRREDIYRAAYGRHTQVKPRRCIFFGTTNEDDYLKDSTGNRRFWPIEIEVQSPTRNVFKDLTETEVDQIWAEAITFYLAGEELYLSGEVDKMASAEQEKHRQVDHREGLILDYLEKEIPAAYDSWDDVKQTSYDAGILDLTSVQMTMTKRERVCVAEVWEKVLKSDLKFLKHADSTKIGSIIKAAGWKPIRANFGKYGRQRGFTKK